MKFDESEFLAKLKEPKPDPGGGATAAYVGLVALTLTEKICIIEIARAVKKRVGHEHLDYLLQQLGARADAFRSLIDQDIRVYSELAASIKSGLQWPANHEIILGAIECPCQIIRNANESITLIEDLGRICARWLIPDLLVALEMALSCAKASYHIANANSEYVEDPVVRKSQTCQIGETFQKATHHYSEVLDALRPSPEKKVEPG
ncbi:MAG: cyclodeaminase/cyclohydrolase family protein [Desulfomonilaceae bacterium]